jgi:putative ATPase
MPESQIILSQTAAYLASCPKSNSAVAAIGMANNDVENLPNYDVPLHIRNAPTKLMKELGYHKGYKYSHDYEGNFTEQQYLPDELKDKIYYFPGENELKIKERLNKLWKNKKR